jgi:hypothetical protein
MAGKEQLEIQSDRLDIQRWCPVAASRIPLFRADGRAAIDVAEEPPLISEV